VPRKWLVEEVVRTNHVAYERDESGWWVASVRGVRGCHTQGRSVDEARRRIREALELFVDDARKVSIVDDVKLPSAATKAIRAYASLRRKADEEKRRAALVLRTGKLKMSAQDTARLLGHRISVCTSSRKEADNVAGDARFRLGPTHRRLSHARASSSPKVWRRPVPLARVHAMAARSKWSAVTVTTLQSRVGSGSTRSGKRHYLVIFPDNDRKNAINACFSEVVRPMGRTSGLRSACRFPPRS